MLAGGWEAGHVSGEETTKEAAMTVASILGRKGRDVVTTSPDRSLQDIATTLVERNIGAVIVTGPAAFTETE